ncbi:hypothetical protein D9M68_811200 [compost metagenome]
MVPKPHCITGTPSTLPKTFSGSSIGSTSPARSASTSATVLCRCANSATSSTSAARSCFDSWLTQPLSTSFSSCSGFISRSLSGSIIAYGRHTWSCPPTAPSSIWKAVVTTASFCVATLANLVCISERMYSVSIGCTVRQALP